MRIQQLKDEKKKNDTLSDKLPNDDDGVAGTLLLLLQSISAFSTHTRVRYGRPDCYFATYTPAPFLQVASLSCSPSQSLAKSPEAKNLLYLTSIRCRYFFSFSLTLPFSPVFFSSFLFSSLPVFSLLFPCDSTIAHSNPRFAWRTCQSSCLFDQFASRLYSPSLIFANYWFPFKSRPCHSSLPHTHRSQTHLTVQEGALPILNLVPGRLPSIIICLSVVNTD